MQVYTEHNKYLTKLAVAFFLATCCIINPITTFAQFTQIADSIGLNLNGTKYGGASWGDFNNDGCLDLLVNTWAKHSRLYLSDCNLPDPNFTDVSLTYAAGLLANICERSAVWGDLNNDGYLDFIRNRWDRCEVYLNKGPSGVPAYSFGDALNNPNLTLTTFPDGMNVEGFGLLDYNKDGWLDLIMENHQYGIDIYENPADGSANFTHVTPNISAKGLPTTATTGDYMAITDFNDDGYPDILARKENREDLWVNNGNGTFTANTTFNKQAGGNKGGVLFCDFDNDGDFDLFWSDDSINQIWEQTGLNSNNFVATNEPATSSSVTPVNTDGCACGDVDNDGDQDLFLTSNAGSNYLFINNGGMSFTRNNMGINVNAYGRSAAFIDYDNDGDLDLYINVDNGNNQLWRNSTNNNNYLKVRILRDLGGGIYRDDIGATAVLKDCGNLLKSGIREVNGTRGHGSQDPAVLHFGLPDGVNASYKLEVKSMHANGNRTLVDTMITPSAIGNEIDMIIPIGAGGFNGCQVLPIELLFFEANPSGKTVILNWRTATESNSHYFKVERSHDGKVWERVGLKKAAGYSLLTINYNTTDETPYAGQSYYRLKQTDLDGTFTYSEIVSVKMAGQPSRLKVYPNPLNGNQLYVWHIGTPGDEIIISLYNAVGEQMHYEQVKLSNRTLNYKFELEMEAPSGFYIVMFKTPSGIIMEKVVVAE